MTEGAPGTGPNTVVRLRVHPVKGARGTDVETLHFEEMGPRFDRRWMVVGPDGGFVTQRDTPRLATIRPTVSGDGLTLEAPDAPAIHLPLTPQGERLQSTVWSSVVDVRSVSPAADTWVSSVLGSAHRLVFMGDDDIRHTDPAYAEGHRVSFADGYPALLVSEGSVDELARRVGREIPVERFRPNIVVSGDRPHEEDFWKEFTIGALPFRGVKLCARCKVTATDQETGIRDPEQEPLRTLARYRRIESLVYFGVNTVHLATGRISLGDAVEVHERGIVRGAI
jgi:hypothetical protein